MRHNWLASLRSYVGSKFYSFSFPISVIGHIFACVCEMQLRHCILFFFNALFANYYIKRCKIELAFSKKEMVRRIVLDNKFQESAE